MQRNKLLLTMVILALWATTAWAATVSFSTTMPADANDLLNIASVAGAALDRDNVGGGGVSDGAGNDGSTYIAYDRPAQGQTFLTGVDSVMIAGVWVRHVGYSGNNPAGTGSGDPNNTYYAMPAASQIIVRITNPAASGTTGFVLASETYTITGTETDILPSTNSADGTGIWIHVALDTPVILAANTTYGFDLAGSSGLFFEALGIRDGATGGNPYAAGTAYSSGGSGAGDNSMAIQTGARVFIVDMLTLRTGAANPTPANGAEGLDSDAAVTLSWDAGKISDPDNPGAVITNPDITSHYVYLSNPGDPNLLDITPIHVDADTNPADGKVDAGASCTLAALLESDSTYYWRVDEIMANANDPNNITGPVWSFNTEKKKAQFDSAYPQDASVTAGQQVTFIVAATNPITGDATGMTYQWYRNGNLLNGQTGTQYVMTASAADDRSTYYCRVTVTSTGKIAQSRTATLFIKKQIAYWTLDGNAGDSAADHLYNGTTGGTAAFDTDRKVGSTALLFNGTDTYVDLPDGMDSFGGGLTFTLWAKPTAAGSWARFLDFGNGAPSDNIYFGRSGTADTLYFSVYNGTTASSMEVANALTADEWQMLTVTMDQGGNVVLYKNGAQIKTGAVSVPNTVVRTINYIGRSNWSADAYYQGLMDDIQVFNYAKTADEIAQMYVLVMGGSFCQDRPAYDFTGPDGTPDCKVDIYELSDMAADWLGCGIYPDCL